MLPLVHVTKILKLAKGHYGARSRAHRGYASSVIKAGQYAFRDRRQKNVNSARCGLHVLSRRTSVQVYLIAVS